MTCLVLCILSGAKAIDSQIEHDLMQQEIRMLRSENEQLKKELKEFRFQKKVLEVQEEVSEIRGLPVKEPLETDILSTEGNSDFKNIDRVKESLSKINWDLISSDWTIKIRQNQFMPYETKELNPFQECSPKNPLYQHKEWLDFVVTQNPKWNLTDSRLASLCGITKDKARYWRRKLKVSRGRNWGFSRYINDRDDTMYIKPENYNNPRVISNHGFILEHRYMIEKVLNQNPDSEISKRCLDKDGYLKSDIIIHHINFDSLDNRAENFLIIFSHSEHKLVEGQIYKFIKTLLREGLILFKNGAYDLRKENSSFS